MENPVVIDDFAHNPSGIKLTIENGAKLGKNLFVVDAIRGSRGDDINKQIACALVESLSKEENYVLFLTCSRDVVNELNTVLDSELDIFTRVLDENDIKYTLFDNLEESLLTVIDTADDDDVILLLGAQGMDPASRLLKKNDII
jgi:UDP-N-acetylmuramyl tripeptide synthase